MENNIYNNPIVIQRADPCIYKHIDGYYYFTASVPAFDSIELRRAKKINDLQDAEIVTVWRKHESGEMSELIWAPEIHYINNKWYIYFAAAPDRTVTGITFNHKMYVIECEDENPLEGRWIEKGKIETGWDSFALDATTFSHNGKLYYVWAQEETEVEPKSHSNIYIAEMENPWTLKSKAVLLSKPELDWETKLYWVNEGPAVIKKNGKVFITYSASATDENYCMGMLTADKNSNLLDSNSWVKSTEPVFKTSYENKQYGPGHNSFTVSEDGKLDLLVYHSRNYLELKGDPLSDPNRHARIDVIHWNDDGTPNFGVPSKDNKEFKV
ncbi:MAG: family 43 glycosylhydrolase [Clostridium sp.]|uniref:glycoside hydrolase family 43 protein n=1 Tax=Clostridium sp. TaxID=1506 RepID=UPI001E17EFBE|nr:family 43 glycosylhydrolase [Clostridium sp.]MBS5938801.1 family 43 glycosylhydrolase [Clostridium sp.]MBS5951796.1 family 43 glycosylhydrolase [Clostridium sp.]